MDETLKIVQYNILFLIGLPEFFIYLPAKILSSEDYFGHYGKVVKIHVNKVPYKVFSDNEIDHVYSMHVVYSNEREASLAILTLSNQCLVLKEKYFKLKASFGTTKICQSFLYGRSCKIKNCFYAHTFENIFPINISKELAYVNQIREAMQLADIFNPAVKNKILNSEENMNLKMLSSKTLYQNLLKIASNSIDFFNQEKYQFTAHDFFIHTRDRIKEFELYSNWSNIPLYKKFNIILENDKVITSKKNGNKLEKREKSIYSLDILDELNKICIAEKNKEFFQEIQFKNNIFYSISNDNNSEVLTNNENHDINYQLNDNYPIYNNNFDISNNTINMYNNCLNFVVSNLNETNKTKQ